MQEGMVGETRSRSALTIGVVADTHVPDRAASLHPNLIPGLRAAKVSAILHAGDISVPSVLNQFEQIAPIYAVRGNRDLLFRSLPTTQHLTFLGVPVVLAHGHGSFFNYLFDKWKYITRGYSLERYQNTFGSVFKEARVIVFGHTHRAENVWHAGQLWFNPGSASISDLKRKCPSFGLLHFEVSGEVRGEIVDLTGAELVKRQWVIS